MSTSCVHIFGLLELFVLIDAFFDKYLFERSKVQCFQYFVFLDFQSPALANPACCLPTFSDFADSEEMRFAVVNHAAVG